MGGGRREVVKEGVGSGGGGGESRTLGLEPSMAAAPKLCPWGLLPPFSEN